MTAFATTDIPSTVNTLEELIAWASTILNELYPNTTIVEAVGTSNRVIECAPFYLTSGQTPQWVLITRATLVLSSNWRRNGKYWNFVGEIGTTAIPTEYRGAAGT